MKILTINGVDLVLSKIVGMKNYSYYEDGPDLVAVYTEGEHFELEPKANQTCETIRQTIREAIELYA